jgi:hypothetical protein
VSAVAVFFFTLGSNRIVFYLSLLLLAEGGIALTIGGAIAVFSPTTGKIGESIFRRETWDAKKQKAAEKQARAWIVTGTFLILASFLVSAL